MGVPIQAGISGSHLKLIFPLNPLPKVNHLSPVHLFPAH